MTSVNKIFGDGNTRPVRNNDNPVKTQKMGTIKLTGLDKTKAANDDNMYPNLQISKTPGNTGVNENTARGTLDLLDYMMQSFVIKP